MTHVYECNGTNVLMKLKMKCSIQKYSLMLPFLDPHGTSSQVIVSWSRWISVAMMFSGAADGAVKYTRV